MADFFLNDKGVWYQQEPSVKGELPSPIWVCSQLEITAITRDDNNENHGKLLRFFDYDGIEHKWAMPMELLAGDGTVYRQTLLSGGLQIQEGRRGRELLSRYIQDSNPKMRATANGLESIAAFHNDCLLCLDELGKLEPKIAGEVAYLLVNGEGKQRCDKSGFARKKQAWRLLFLSSGEIGLPDLIRQSGQKVRGGHEVRVVDIPAFTGKYGVFDHLHFFSSGDAFSRMLYANAEKYHGTAGKAFIKELVYNKSKHLERIKRLIEHFKEANTPLGADGQVLRVLNRFALIAAAGTLATGLGITGWTEEDAMWASKQCFDSWLKNRGSISAQEGHEILRQIRHFFEQHGDSRFSTIGEGDERMTINRAGYKRRVNEGWHYLVLPESFKQDLCDGFDVQTGIAILIEKEWLIPDSEGKNTRAEYLPSSKSTVRCYRIDGNKVFNDEI